MPESERRMRRPTPSAKDADAAGATGKPTPATGQTGKHKKVARGDTMRMKAVTNTGKMRLPGKAAGGGSGSTSARHKAVSAKSARAESSVSKDRKRAGSGARSKKTTTDKSAKPSSSGESKRMKAVDAEAIEENKKQKRAVRYSLALKFTIPVAILIMLTTFLVGSYAVRQVRGAVLNEIKKNGASKVMGLASYGRKMILDRKEKGNKWAAIGKYAPQKDLVEMALALKKESETKRAPAGDAGTTGTTTEAQPEETLSNAELTKLIDELDERWIVKATEQSRLLEFFTNYFTDAGERKTNEVLDAYISIPQGSTRSDFVASATEFSGRVGIDYDDPWISEAELKTLEIGDTEINLTDVGIGVRAAWVTQNGVKEKALTFENKIKSSGIKGFHVGDAIITLSAEVIESEQARLRNLMLMLGTIAVLVATGICVFISRVVTKPVKILVEDMKLVAEGDLTHRTDAHSNDEIGMIAGEFNVMTQRLAIARKAEREAERLENELDMAREIQMKLLPARIPSVKGFDIHAVYKPAKEVGGDYYDFFPIDREHIGMIVADVSGKGIPGSMVMATTRTVLRFTASNNLSAANTLARTNAIVNADIKRGMFVTAFYLVLDARRRTMICASAGHNPMVIVHPNGGLDTINPNGIALGFDKGPIFQRTIKEAQVQLGVGDRVVLYTDGVVEAMNAQNEEYTDERFYEFCKNTTELNSREFTDALLADLERHKGKAPQHDDITVLTIKITEA